MSVARRIGQSGVFPVILGGAVWGGLMLLQSGISGPRVIAGVFFAVLTLTTALEWASPYDARWRPGFQDFLTDLGFYFLQFFTKSGLQVGALLATGLLNQHFGWFDAVRVVPAWVRVAGAFFLADLAKYALHRASHEIPGLWKFHQIHHLPRKLNGLNSLRSHPVNVAWLVLPEIVFSLLLGLKGAEVVGLGLFRGTLSILQHATFRMRLSPWSQVFATPDRHKWHHSILVREANTNYGSSLIVWYRFFGTLYVESGQPEDLGVAQSPGVARDHSLLSQLAGPFLPNRPVSSAGVQHVAG